MNKIPLAAVKYAVASIAITTADSSSQWFNFKQLTAFIDSLGLKSQSLSGTQLMINCQLYAFSVQCVIIMCSMCLHNPKSNVMTDPLNYEGKGDYLR